MAFCCYYLVDDALRQAHIPYMQEGNARAGQRIGNEVGALENVVDSVFARASSPGWVDELTGERV